MFSFLVPPGKGRKDYLLDIGATHIPLEGKLYKMLYGVFEKADSECKDPIAFLPDKGDVQQNSCRDLILAFLGNPALETGFPLAKRLQLVTDERSGFGLLFLALGEAGREKKLVLSRFPADQGIIAEADEKELHIEFIEKVFLRKAHAYKAALYRGRSLTGGFWNGRAIDKQRDRGGVSISHYWRREFLQSDFKTTGPAGSKRTADMFSETMRSCNDPEIKQEIAAAAVLVKGLDGESVTLNEIADRYSFSDTTQNALFKKVQREAILDDRFEFSFEEFQKHLPYRSLELSNGAMMTAAADSFDNIFQRSTVPNNPEEVQFTTQGRIENDFFRKTK